MAYLALMGMAVKLGCLIIVTDGSVQLYPQTQFIYPFMVITQCFLYPDSLETNSIRTSRYKMKCCPVPDHTSLETFY